MRDRTYSNDRPKPSYVVSGDEPRVDYLPVGGYTQMRGGQLFEAGDDEFDSPMISGYEERRTTETREDAPRRAQPANAHAD